MNRKLHNLRGPSTHPGNQIPRWRIVFIALMLALTFGSAGQTPLAQAAPAADKIPIKFELGIYPEKLPKVRTCDKLKLYVGIHKTVYKTIDDTVFPLAGYTPGPRFVTGKQTSGTGSLQQQLGDIDDPGASIPFVFTPDKVGKVTLKFTATINSAWVGANEAVIGSDVKIEKEIKFAVIPCKLAVKTIIQFPVGIYDITVMSDDAVMTADEAGTFTGSTSMAWVYSNFNLAPCTIEIGATDSQVDMTGQVDEDGGQFTATQTFQPQTVAGTVTCPVAGSRSASGGFTVSPLTFSVASTGGVSTQAANAEGVSGSATIIVTSEDEGAAFIPGDHQVSWDDFSSLFSTLLVLY